MSGSVEIVLWLQEYKLQALEAQLARDGCSTEKLLQDMLDDLYHRRVPLDIQREISERLDAEAAAELAERDANTTWAAYHITEHGDDQYFKTPTGDELLTAAGRLRSYLHQGDASRWPRFSSLLFHRQEIRKEEFEQLFNDDYLNVYADFDLDTGEVCDALTVIYICGDGAEEAYRYPLTGEERAVLRTRMDGYCMEQTGMGLEEHRSQYLAETDGPAQGPRM